MAQSTKTIESVWAAKGNLPDNAIVATADGKYPALDGSLITNVGAGDLLAANNLSELTATASVARTNLELGAADTVEFGGFVPPSGTTAEIDAITNAVVGQVMINSDAGQIVRFTGASTYELITSTSTTLTDESAPSASISLDDSKIAEGGLIDQSPSVIAPVGSIDYFNSSLGPIVGSPHFYHDGAQIAAGWYANGQFGATDGGYLIPSGTTFRIKNDTSNNIATLAYHRYFTSDTTYSSLVSADLKAGTSYEMTFSVKWMNTHSVQNAKARLEFSGSFSDSTISIDLDNGRDHSALTNLSVSPSSETLEIPLDGSSASGVSATAFSRLTLTASITPSTSGSISLDMAQLTSQVNPLFLSKAKLIIVAQST